VECISLCISLLCSLFYHFQNEGTFFSAGDNILLQLSDEVQGYPIAIVNKVRVGCLVPCTVEECGGCVSS